jgi:hypothetical protein
MELCFEGKIGHIPSLIAFNAEMQSNNPTLINIANKIFINIMGKSEYYGVQ